MEILEQLFGSAAKVKIMRLFLFNPSATYDVKDIQERAKVQPAALRKEINLLHKIGFIKKKVFAKDVKKVKGKKTLIIKQKTNGWVLDTKFYYLAPLQNFLIHLNPLRHQEIIRKLNRVGKIKLLIISGVFIQEVESRIDILVVGDHLKTQALESVIGTIEAEIGKELKYSTFETSDFQYRLGMCDKLVRDILDYPHEKVIDKLGVS